MSVRAYELAAAVFLLGISLAAGCSSPPATAPPPDDAAAGPPALQLPPGGLPPGCQGDRPAVAHSSGARPEPNHTGPPAFPCQSYVGFSSLEPTLGISPKSGTVFFYPAALEGVPVRVGVARSTDQGASWQRIEPGVGGANLHSHTADPYFYLDPATGRIFADDLVTVNCSVLSFSDDEGLTWTHAPSGCAEFDHQTLFAGPPVASTPVGYPNVVYRCAINLVALADASTSSTCMKSLDGGLSFVPTGAPAFGPEPAPGSDGPDSCDGATGHGTVGPDGTVYLPKGWCGQPYLAISRDEGLSWVRVQVSTLGMPYDGAYDHEAGVGVDEQGRVYYAWIAQDRFPHLTVSEDGGRTWSDPILMAPPNLKEAALGELAVGGPGRLAFAYMGSQNSPGAPFPVVGSCLPDAASCLEPLEFPQYANVTWDGYITVTGNALDPNPVFLSASINDARDPLVRGTCGPFRCQQVYDFLDVRIGPDGTAWASFVDACIEDCSTGQVLKNNAAQGLVGRVVGGPDLMEATDPNPVSSVGE